jgi:arylsulfatase A-like enzyme
MHKYIHILLSLIVALSIGSCTSEKPNIIFLLSDDQRSDTFGAAGNTSVKTPNLDQLAKEGALFKNAFVTTSNSYSSRASILTGQYASKNGVTDGINELSDQQFENTYPIQLKKNGYQIAFIGKYGIGESTLKREKNAFDYFWGESGQPKYEHLTGTGETIQYTELLQQRALEFLEGTSKNKPFCLSVSFIAPSIEDDDFGQFTNPTKYADVYKDDVLPAYQANRDDYDEKFPDFFKNPVDSIPNEARKIWELRFSTPEKHQKTLKEYYHRVTAVDAVVGKLRKKLAEKGLSENTVIIYMSDNGLYLGEHGLAGKWYGHEPSIRVPLLVHDPRLKKSQRGKAYDQMALNIDIAPTILKLAGIAPDVNMQGKPLTHIYKEESDTWRKQFYYEQRSLLSNIPRSQGIRTEKYKYLYYFDAPFGYEELYDLENDPDETNNLAPNSVNKEVLKDLRNRVKNNFEIHN